MTAVVTFPCREDKRPKISAWQELTESRPHAKGQHYGILCGKASNLTVIDLDLIKDKECPEEYMCGVAAWEMLKEYLVDESKIPTVRTKNGGLHLYFRYCEELKSGIQRVNGAFFGCPGKKIKIDVLSGGKYVIGPESPGYKLISGEESFEDPPELPLEIVKLLTPVAVKKEKAVKQLAVAKAGHDDVDTAAGPVSFQLLKSVVAGIPHRHADDRAVWLKVVWAIAETASMNGYDALEIADTFSRRSDKYKNHAEIQEVYSQNNGSVKFGTLQHLSEHKPGEVEEDLEAVNTGILVEDLSEIEQLKHATSVTRIVENKDVKVISLALDNGSDKEIIVYKSSLVVVENNEFIGYIRDMVSLTKEDLSVVHSQFGDDVPTSCLLKDKDTIEFVCRTKQGGEHSIRVKNPWNSKIYLTKHSNGKQVGSLVKSKKQLEIVLGALENGCRSLLKERYNITIYNNGGDVINNYGKDQDREIDRTEFALIQALLAGKPGIVDVFKFCDNGKANNFDGLFVCSSVSGVWKKTHNALVERMLQARLKKHVVGLTESETRMIESHANIQALRKMFVKEVYDEEFEGKIDENLGIFALQNGSFDLELKALRRTQPQDYALTCAGWKYSRELSEKHMDEVVGFFRKILPVPEERDIVLTFMASLLHGHRIDKKFLVLTDKRSGNNGKSTLLALLRVFFGDYLKSSTKFFCKGHFDKDKDSHDAGMEPMKGKRVVLADELKKSMRLDDALIKNLAGGHYVVEGRRIGVNDQFRFTWQAGIIMVFNEGDCPKFDPTDTAFMERMLVCPMRSKFVVCEEDDEDSYTFRIDRAIHDNFDNWRSALLDYLAVFCHKEGLGGKSIPPAMAEWKDEIVTNNNDVGEWITEHTEAGNPGEFVSINELREMYVLSVGYSNKMSSREFNSAAKALFVGKGYHTKDSHNYREGGERKHARNVVLGIKMKV